MERIIFHIDVNSAFLSWTSVENLRTGRGPDLRLIPAVIGGDQSSRHGIVLAKSIPAKAFGIYTSQPVAQALRLCGDLTVYPPEHELYRRFSRELMAYLKSLTPDVEQLSIDECFLDFTGIAHRYPSPVQAAHSIRDTIYARFGFTVNIGISSNKLLAKMASDFEKPNRVHTLFPSEVPEKMWPLPVGELYMAGRSEKPSGATPTAWIPPRWPQIPPRPKGSGTPSPWRRTPRPGRKRTRYCAIWRKAYPRG